MPVLVQGNNAISGADVAWPAFITLLKAWLVLGCMTLLLAPGARGYSAEFGYVAYWLVIAPLLLIGASRAGRWRALLRSRKSPDGLIVRCGIRARWTPRNRRCHYIRPLARPAVRGHA